MNKNKIGSLEQEALKRKQRLQALKKNNDEGKEISENDDKLPAPKFRSYKPQDDNLKKSVVDEAKVGDVESEVEDQLKLAINSAVIEDLDINNLAPRKPDWDLKRDITKKLAKLERRTQKAIAELIRDRLKGQQNLAAVVSVGTDKHR